MSSKTWRGVVLLLAVVVACMVACVAVAQSATATVPPLVKVSGALANAQGTVGVTFALYAEQTGGAPLWLETQNVTPDANGRYTVYLGANHANGVPLNLFASGEARWLGVQPEGQPEQARAQLVSVPYALTAGDAQTLGGQPLSAFVLASAANGNTATSGATTASTSAGSGGIVALAGPQAGGTPVATTGGLTNYLAKFNNTIQAGDVEDSLIFDNGTYVGIGTTAPAAKLHVVSSSTPAGFIDVYSNTLNAVTFVTRAARGTLGSPSAVQTDDIIGGFTARGWGTTGFSGGRGSLIIHANEPWTDAAQSTYIQFNTAPLGQAYQTERMRIDNAGNVGIGATTPTSPLTVMGLIQSASGLNEFGQNVTGGFKFPDNTVQTTAAAGSVTNITAASGSGLTVANGTSTAVIGTDPTVLQMRINAACPAGTYMTLVNSAGGINCSGVVSNPGTVTNVSAVSGSGLTVTNATSTPQINTDFTVLQKRVAAGCPAGQFLQSIAVDGTPSCFPLYSAAPSGFTTLGASPAPLSGYTVSAWVAISGRIPWSQTASLNTARYQHGVVSIGSKIFVVGGYGASGPLSSLEQYNTSNAPPAWSTVTPGRYFYCSHRFGRGNVNGCH